jgi:DNA-binding CsgD family transcriptional regulator
MDATVRLTAREADVLQLLARGCTYAEVGDALGVSRHTVASHVKSAYLKLEVHSAAGAVMRAIELRLIGIAGSWDVRHAVRRLRFAPRNLRGRKR